MKTSYLPITWPAPKNIRAFATTRIGGNSKPPYDGFNLGYKSGDDPAAVTANRLLLKQELQLPAKTFWPNQVSANNVVDAATADLTTPPTADASFTTTPNIACCILTADCMPILLCDRKGTVVAAIHAGWRGMATGIIAATISKLPVNPSDLLAWLGPTIGPNKFEVGAEVRAIFLAHDKAAEQAFLPSTNPDHFLANLYLLAKQRLLAQNVTAIFGGDYCTYTQKELFFSHRREHGKTGRMASGIWIA